MNTNESEISRRSFLKYSTAAATAFTVILPLPFGGILPCTSEEDDHALMVAEHKASVNARLIGS
jgi:hypothetical protein